MQRSATSEKKRPFDPSRRYRAIEAAARRARENGETYDALEAMVESVYAAEVARFTPRRCDDGDPDDRTQENLERVRCGVEAAIATYDTDTTRQLFDACLLAGATEEQLVECFAVDPLETAAYRHLFFDRNVFPNAFHVVHYIATVEDPHEQTLLRIAQSQGFDAIAAQYGLPRTVTPEDALSNVLAADAAAYRRHRELPITHQSIKDIRTLGKQVVETAKAVQKVHESKASVADRARAGQQAAEFVLVAASPNPTLRELMDAGGELASPSQETH